MKKPAAFLRNFIIASLSGVLLWLSWPQRGWTPLVFGALVPLLWIERDYEQREGKGNGRKVFFWFFVSMAFWNGLTTWWIWNSTSAGSIVALGLNSLFMAFIWQLFYYTKRDHGPAIGYTSLLLFWIGFEYLHLNWDISWPWLTLGNVFAVRPEWVQWYEYTGVLGGSLWVVASNILVFQVTKNLFSKELLLRVRQINTIVLTFSVIILISIPILISYHLYDRRADVGEPANIVVVQPNVDPYNEKFNGTGNQQLIKFLQLASTVTDSTTDYVIGPETALPDGMWEEEIYIHPSLQTIRKFIEPYPKLTFITGLSSYKHYENGEKVSITARKFKDSDEYYDAYNSALQLDSSGFIQLYHKSKLVPGVEKMPYPRLFGFLEKYAIQLGGTGGSLGIQEHRINFTNQVGTTVAPAICYESIYGDFMAGYIRNGAEFIAVITNDGWWGNTPGYRQHMEYSRLRAVEFRKSIARSANTGISCFINQRGDIIRETKWWEADAIKETLLKNKIVTFYARYGDYIGFIAAFLSVSLLVFMLLKRLLNLV